MYSGAVRLGVRIFFLEKNCKISLSFGSFLLHIDFLLLECSLRSGDDESNLIPFFVSLIPPTLLSLSTNVNIYSRLLFRPFFIGHILALHSHLLGCSVSSLLPFVGLGLKCIFFLVLLVAPKVFLPSSLSSVAPSPSILLPKQMQGMRLVLP